MKNQKNSQKKKQPKKTLKRPKRSNTFRQIVDAAPELADDIELKELGDDLDEAKALLQFADSEGGQILRDRTLSACRGLLTGLFQQVTDPNLNQLVATISQIKANMGLLIELDSAEENHDELQALVDQVFVEKRD